MERKKGGVFRTRARAILRPPENHAMAEPTSPAEKDPDPAGLVSAIAALARLDVTPGEAAELGAQFVRTLAHFEGLARLDLSGVEPLASPSGAVNVLRADVPEPSFEPERLLANAPEREDDFYRVPKTVGGES